MAIRFTSRAGTAWPGASSAPVCRLCSSASYQPRDALTLQSASRSHYSVAIAAFMFVVMMLLPGLHS